MIGGITMEKICLSEEQQKEFERLIKIGILKTLRDKDFITDAQLERLLRNDSLQPHNGMVL